MEGVQKANHTSMVTIHLRHFFSLSGLMLVAIVASLLTVPVTFAAQGGLDVQARDDCDAVTFNAGRPANSPLCVLQGHVTLAEFLARANPHDGGHNAWKFSRSTLGIKPGQVVQLSNSGGENHTFTEVRAFGTGLVASLNNALPPGTPPADVINPAGLQATFIAPQQNRSISGLSTGSHLFQCMLHPWMRTTIEVKP